LIRGNRHLTLLCRKADGEHFLISAHAQAIGPSRFELRRAQGGEKPVDRQRWDRFKRYGAEICRGLDVVARPLS
jgi:hypothetical protein